MTVNTKSFVAVLVICACWTQPARARQDPVAGEFASLVEQVQGLNRSLERLVVLLEDSLDKQQVNLLLKRIELKERRLAPLEAQLRQAESRLSSSESEASRMARMLEEQEKMVQQEIRAGGDPATLPSRGMVAEIKMHLEVEQAQIEEQRRRIRAVEDEVAQQREDIEVLDELLAEMLE